MSTAELVLQIGHPGAQTVVASPDGHQAVTVGGRSFVLWDVETGRVLRHWDATPDALGSTFNAQAARFAPDGTLLLGDQRAIRRVDPRDGRELDRYDYVLSDDARYLGLPASPVIGPDGHSMAVVAFEGGDAKASARVGHKEGSDAAFLAFLQTGSWSVTRVDLVSDVVQEPLRVHLTSAAGVLMLPDGRLLADDGSGRIDEIPVGISLAGSSPMAGPDGTLLYIGPTGQVEVCAECGSGAPTGLMAVAADDVILLLGPDGGIVRGIPVEGATSAAVAGDRLLWLQDDVLHAMDRDTETELWVAEPHPMGVSSIAWADAQSLWAADEGGIRSWDLGALRSTGETPIPTSTVRSDGSHILALDTSGIRLYTASGELTTTLANPKVIDATFAPDGRILVAFSDGRIAWWRPKSGTIDPIVTLPTRAGEPLFLAGLEFTPDGKWLVMANGDALIVADVATGAPQAIVQLVEPANRKHAYAGGAFAAALAVSPDGAAVYVVGNGQRGLYGADRKDSAYVEAWSLPDLRPLGHSVGLEAMMTSVAVAPNGRSFVTGDASGAVIRWDPATMAPAQTLTQFGSRVTSVAYSPDGAWVAAASDVEGVRLEHANGELSLAADPHGTWVAFTPDGLFDASREGGSRLAMVDGLAVSAVDQLSLQNNRPDLVLERFGLGDPALLTHFRAQSEARLKRAGVQARSPTDVHAPTAEINATRQEGRSFTFSAALADDRGELASAMIWVNGVPVNPDGEPVSGWSATLERTVTLSPGDNDIEVSVRDRAGVESRRALVRARWDGESAGELWFVGLGVSTYADPTLNLGFAHQDALDLGAVMEGMRFADTHVRTYTNESATRAALHDAKAFLAGAGLDDTVVVFVAGHGLHDDDAARTYYFLPHEADRRDLAATAVPYAALEELLSGVPSRDKLLLLDTCESGESEDPVAAGMVADSTARGARAHYVAGAAADEPPPWTWDRERWLYADLVRRTGAVVLSSSRGGEYSFESSSIANGFFTEELVAALTSDVADLDHDGVVRVEELRTYVAAAVAARSRDRQHPTVDRDNPHSHITLPIVR